MLKQIRSSRLISFLIAGVLLLSIFFGGGIISNASGSSSAKAAKVTLKINNNAVKLPYAPVLVSGVYLAPAEAFAKSLGAAYKYDPKAKTISIKKSKTTIIFKLGSKSAKVNGKAVNADAAPKLIKIPFIPVKFTGGKLGYTKYSFDPATNTIDLSTPPSPIHIYIAGDSTAEAANSYYAPLTGWGQVLGTFFDSGVKVVDYAYSGESSKSYADEGNLDLIVDKLKPGDYFFISFGHNDEKIDKPAYYTDPNTTYKEYLTKYITGARSKKAIPVLITSVARRQFDENGVFTNSHGDYPAAMIALGQSLNVPVIDLNQKSMDLFTSIGVEKTKELFMWLDPGQYPAYPNGDSDNTHFQKKGAIAVANLIVQGVKESVGPPLASHILSPAG